MGVGEVEAEPARYPMPLLCSSFGRGELEAAVAAVEGPDLRGIARAEAFYFTARPEEAFDAAGPYLQSDDPALRLSACFICAYASLSLDRPVAAKKFLAELRSLKAKMLSGAPEMRAAYVLLATASAVLLHLDPSFTEADLAASMRHLPEGLALFASYVQAHRAYFHGEHGRCVGIAENALAMARRPYPIPEQFLHLVAAMGWISLKDVGRARDHFEQAWAIAAADDLIEEIGEHHGLLQGVMETCLREAYPADFARVVKVTYRFSYGWRRIHNPEAGEEVADDLTTTEFAMAMLACRDWSNDEIARHMGVSRGTVKNRLSSVYAKLGICSRAELARYMLR